MQVPKLLKICLNQGLGEAVTDKKMVEQACGEMSLISGQKAVITTAKNDISNFKIRKGWPVGCKVTLRSKKMYEFLERLISVALPRTRDFRGLSFKSFDAWGNYNFGIKEQIIFPEVNFDKVDKIRGLDITIVIKSQKVEHSYELLKHLNFPFRETRSN